MRSVRGLAAAAIATVGLISATAVPAAAGVGGPAFYVDGQLYRTVGTPTDLSNTGAPSTAWDVIYDFGGSQLNVAEAADGDTNHNGVLDSAEEIAATLAAGSAVDAGVVKQFECPAIPLPAV
jgi:hypothetical protein